MDYNINLISRINCIVCIHTCTYIRHMCAEVVHVKQRVWNILLGEVYEYNIRVLFSVLISILSLSSMVETIVLSRILSDLTLSIEPLCGIIVGFPALLVTAGYNSSGRAVCFAVADADASS